MFWTLYLAHLLGDYALQTDGMARAKRHWPGLALHATIHLALLLLVAGSAIPQLWPQLLALAALHFAIDALKSAATARRPERTIAFYFVDQALHLLTILGVAAWIEQGRGVALDRPWMVYACGYLLATYVWFITERILVGEDAEYRQEVEDRRWLRMGRRALALTVYLLAARALVGSERLALGPAIAFFRDRTLLLDLLVALGAAVLVVIFV